MKIIKLILVIAALLVGLFLRLHNYSIYPQRGATSDEYFYAFLGVSLLTKYEPISWSAIPIYKERSHLTINKLYFPIVKPNLDHPPLFGLLVGAWTMLFGQTDFAQIKLSTIRLVPIFLSTISSLLIFMIGKHLYGFKTGFWALLIYSTVAIFVVNSRVVVAESLIIVLLLAVLYVLLLSSKGIFYKKAVIMGVLCGLTFLSKVLGIVSFLTIFYFLVIKRATRKVFFSFGTTFLLFFLGFILYGFYFGGSELFLKVQAYQAEREIGPQTVWTILTNPIIVNKSFNDGWYFLGLLSLFFSLFNYRKYKYIVVPSIVYFLLLVVSLTQTDRHGWYVLPLFPFMAIATAEILRTVTEKQNWFIFVFLILLGASQIHFLYEIPFGLTPIVFRILILILIFPVGLAIFFKKENMYRLVGNTWFYLFILGNIFITLQYKHPA